MVSELRRVFRRTVESLLTNRRSILWRGVFRYTLIPVDRHDGFPYIAVFFVCLFV